jgi:hypothetical protein
VLKHALLSGAFVVLVVVSLSGSALAQEASSAPLAKELTSLLDQRKLDTVAAMMPGDDGRFAAALYYPNSQLLIVCARAVVPALLKEQLGKREYRDMYMALNGSGGVREGQLFITDMGANGFPAANAAGGDTNIVYEGTQQTIFNGDWQGQKISEADYRKRFDSAEEHYARILAALLATLKTGG